MGADTMISSCGQLNQCSPGFKTLNAIIVYNSILGQLGNIQQMLIMNQLGYSSKQATFPRLRDTNSSQSSPKYALYKSPIPFRDSPIKSAHLYLSAYKKFTNVKKISEDISILRQTISLKIAERRKKRSQDPHQEKQQRKIDFYLHLKIRSKAAKVGKKVALDNIPKAKDQNCKQDANQKCEHNPDQEAQKVVKIKQALNEQKTPLSEFEYQKIAQKINRNNRLIQLLKKTAHNDDDFLLGKNIRYKNILPKINPENVKLEEGQRTFKKTKDTGFAYASRLYQEDFMPKFKSQTVLERKKNSQSSRKEYLFNSLATFSHPKVKQLHQKYTRINLSDQFLIGKKLGEGKFGCVNLAIHKTTSSLFALKKIPKDVIKNNWMVDQLALEIRLQSCLYHRNILGLYGFFDDVTNFYIVLQYMDGGTLYEKLQKGKLSQKETACIIKQMASAVEYMHDQGIAHRDIKPENIVISHNVYKLCDFGWAALCNERRKTYCGTFDYVAPQILQGVDYDMSVDLWCLGVMTFELLTGKAPFYHISRKQTMKKILNVQHQTIQYPAEMSEDAKDLIDKLIRKNPLDRIKASQILMHPFLINVPQE